MLAILTHHLQSIKGGEGKPLTFCTTVEQCMNHLVFSNKSVGHGLVKNQGTFMTWNFIGNACPGTSETFI